LKSDRKEDDRLKDLFISHSHADKTFVRQLARDCEAQDLSVWVDEAELLIGDSLVQTIQKAIDSTKFFLVVVSTDSVNSSWVQRELEQAMDMEISSKTVRVLPVVLGKIQVLPGFLRGKIFADFSKWPNDSKQYAESLAKLIRSVKVRNQSRPGEHDVKGTDGNVEAPASPGPRLQSATAWAGIATILLSAVLLAGVTTRWISWIDAMVYWAASMVFVAIAYLFARRR
jgi:hypothetical protein